MRLQFKANLKVFLPHWEQNQDPVETQSVTHTSTHTHSPSGSEVRAVKWVSCGAIGAVTFRSVIHPAQTSVFSHNSALLKTHGNSVCPWQGV